VIPLRDTIVSSTRPVVTYALIAANVVVYLHQQSLGSGFEPFIETHGLVPRRLVAEWWSDVTPLFSSMFMHGGWLHLLGNVLYLHIFGDNVEDRLGHVRYLVFYLLAGGIAVWRRFSSIRRLRSRSWGPAVRSPASPALIFSSFPGRRWSR